MRILSKDEVLQLHRMLINDTGGSHGLRDESLLESALNMPFSSFDSIDLFPTLLEKAARLALGLIGNHPFIDGNKRIGIMAMQIMLHMNGVNLSCDNDELVRLGLGIAKSEMKHEDILEWLKINTEPM